MFYQLLFIHLFRPFLKYKQHNSPLPNHVSPRKFLTHAASTISKLLRLYKRTHGLRQICNIVVYITHSACTIHLLNLPEKNAARDIVHGLKHLEEIGECWLCARRTLGILRLVATRWNIEMPEEAGKAFMRAEAKFGPFKEQESLSAMDVPQQPPTPMQPLPPPVANQDNTHQHQLNMGTGINEVQNHGTNTNGFYTSNAPMRDAMANADIPSIDTSLSMPPPPPPVLGFGQPHQQQQRSFAIPQAQPPNQNTWVPPPTTPAPSTQKTTSPTMLFGGVDALVQDQEWWLRDSNQMFANWNGMEHEVGMQGNAGFDMGTGNLGYGSGGNGVNGINSVGNGGMGNGLGNGYAGYTR